MKDPKRWSDPGGGADAEIRALLQQAPRVAPSESQASQMWAGLAPQVDLGHPPPGPNGSPSQPGHAGQATAAAGAGAVAGKVALVVVLATAAGALGVRVVTSRDRHEAEPGSARTEPRPSRPTVDPIPPEPSGRPAAATTVPADELRGSRARPEKRARSRSVASVPSPAPAIPVQPWAGEDRRPAPAIPAKPWVSEDRGPAPTVPAKPWVDEDRARPAPTVPAQPWVGEDRARPGPAAPAKPWVDEDRTPPERARALPEVAPQTDSPPVSVNELLQESRRLDRARTALRADEPAHALRLLRESTPGTAALAQEREALTIEAQAAIPALRAAATERARAFLHAYPKSPYRARIKAIVFDGQ